MRLISFDGQTDFQNIMFMFNDVRNRLLNLNHAVVEQSELVVAERGMPMIPAGAEMTAVQLATDELIVMVLKIDELENRILKEHIMRDGVLQAAFRGVSDLESADYSGYFDFPEWRAAFEARSYLVNVWPEHTFQPLGAILMKVREQTYATIQNWQMSATQRASDLAALCWVINDAIMVVSALMITSAQTGVMISASYRMLAARMGAADDADVSYDIRGRIQTRTAEVEIPDTVLNIDSFVNDSSHLVFTRLGTTDLRVIEHLMADLDDVFNPESEVFKCPGKNPQRRAGQRMVAG
jgi:hypothetical protein